MDKFKCMLAKPLDEKKLKFPCLISPKLDGIRAQYYKGEFYTRNKKVIRGMDHLKEQLKSLQHEAFDGELLVPGIPFQKSSGLIRSFNQTPEAEFHVFDMPHVDNGQEGRLMLLSSILLDLGAPNVKIVEHSTLDDAAEIVIAYRMFRERGYEGAMVKKLDGLYTNTRSACWMKMKEIETFDVLCTRFFEGQGRLTGTLGGIFVDLDDVSVRVGGGFSDDERDDIWANQDKYQGMICEIAGQELTPGGSLRHPRFITWREDL